eukprot:4739370-Pyramimonas_sp.AAC.1
MKISPTSAAVSVARLRATAQSQERRPHRVPEDSRQSFCARQSKVAGPGTMHRIRRSSETMCRYVGGARCGAKPPP